MRSHLQPINPAVTVPNHQYTNRHSDEFLAIYFLGSVLNRALEQIGPDKLYQDRQRIPVNPGQHPRREPSRCWSAN
jgi:hypothetical protein